MDRAEFQWTNLYVDYVQRITTGRDWLHSVRGGFSAGLVRNTPYGPGVPQAVRDKADQLREAVRAGSQVVFAGPLRSNAGVEVIAPGVHLDSTAPELEKLFWLADGIVGSIPK